MHNEQSEIVMNDSPEAAQYRTNISGWVSRHGRFYGDDERAARYDGCTHTKCRDCSKPVTRNRLYCHDCEVLRDKARYDAMPKEIWDGKGMIYSQKADRYFSSFDELEYLLEDDNDTIEDLRLVICEPNYLPLIDYDYGYDELPEDGELPDAVIEAIEKFNEVIKATSPVSWSPGNKAVLLNEQAA